MTPSDGAPKIEATQPHRSARMVMIWPVDAQGKT